MKTTIIIPSYGQEEYIREAIESVLNQTVVCEIIVVDDGSPDKSNAIVEQYETSNLKLIKQTNRGLASARNSGIMNATGEFILPLDADDVLHSTCVEKLEKIMDETDADVVGPSLEFIGTHTGHTILTPKPTLSHFKKGNHLGYFSLIRKSALLAVGGFSPKMVEGYEDLHLWINLLIRGYTIETTPEILVKYRTKEKSMWQDAKKHDDKLMAQIYKDFPDFEKL